MHRIRFVELPHRFVLVACRVRISGKLRVAIAFRSCLPALRVEHVCQPRFVLFAYLRLRIGHPR